MATPGKRLANWSPEEDEQLARSWVHISEDPIRANSQKREEFWARATLDFNKYAPSGPRETKSLMNRWSHLQKATLKFTAIYSRIASNPPSGSAPSDWLKSARELFLDETGKKFGYERAWEVLKDVAKWECMASTKPSVPSQLDPSQHSTPTSSHPDTPITSETPLVKLSTRVEQQLTGVRAAKHQLQQSEFMRCKLKVLEANSQHAAVRVAEFQRANSMQERLVEAEMHRTSADVHSRRFEVMQKDINSCPDEFAREFLLYEKKRILEEMEEEDEKKKQRLEAEEKAKQHAATRQASYPQPSSTQLSSTHPSSEPQPFTSSPRDEPNSTSDEDGDQLEENEESDENDGEETGNPPQTEPTMPPTDSRLDPFLQTL